MGLSALMGSPRQRRVFLGGEALRRLAREFPESLARRDMLFECVWAYLQVDEEQRAEFERLLQEEPYQEVQAVTTTIFGRGVEEGRQEGVQEGLILGRRQSIRVFLETKFGTLPEAVIQRLEAWPAERLQELLVAVASASSLAELGLVDS